jgi:hypothetical protein
LAADTLPALAEITYRPLRGKVTVTADTPEAFVRSFRVANFLPPRLTVHFTLLLAGKPTARYLFVAPALAFDAPFTAGDEVTV